MLDEDGIPEYEDEEDEFVLGSDLSGAEGIPSADDDDDVIVVGKPKSGKAGAKGKRVKGGGSFTPDDIGNATRLLSKYGQEMRWNDGEQEWMIWDGQRWVTDSHEAVRRAMSVGPDIVKAANDVLTYEPEDKVAKRLLDWGHQCGNASRVRAMLELSRSFEGVSADVDEFNADGRLMNCPNGTLVLGKSGASFRETRREDLMTKVAGAEFVVGAVSSMWDNFLDTFLPEEELRLWAQKVAGYSMLGRNPGRRIVFCIGPTSSGKSTFAELVQDAMGSYAGAFNLSMMRDNQDERSRPDLVRAMDRRAIFASEASSEWVLHADMVKRITGQDRIQARLPHVGTAIEKKPSFTPWVVSNSTPTIKGADQALYRRLCTVVFPHTISESRENSEFREELRERGQLPGILAWLVEGWNMYAREGLGDAPARVMKAELKMRDEFSDLDVFLSETCDTGGSYKAIPSELYAAYENWHDANGAKPADKLSGTSFGRALSARGFITKHVREGEATPKRRVGIRLKKGSA